MLLMQTSSIKIVIKDFTVFVLVSLFNGISISAGYLIPNASL